MDEGLDQLLTTQWSRFERLLSARISRLSQRPGVPAKLVEAMRYSLEAPGKRLRAILVLCMADSVARASNGGGVIADDCACAVEWIHTYSLIHDDLPAMDDDDLRRGRPTNHKVYGEAVAILAGDALLTEALGLVARGEGAPSALRARLVAELCDAAGAAGMVGGQVLDIADDRPAEEAYLLRMHAMKTGALIRVACRLGAQAADASDEQLAWATTYGESLGLAFQIVDDLLDVSATPEQMGKPTGADAAAGRFTFPAVFGLERSRQMARECVAKAVEAARKLDPEGTVLPALARFTLERAS